MQYEQTQRPILRQLPPIPGASKDVYQRGVAQTEIGSDNRPAQKIKIRALTRKGRRKAKRRKI